ncbi:hypothetical protein JCM3775_002167 [Rhodotorula graminis]|uniref:MYND-type domain-containing protein n=1 Tax=Rhodotorula graminis (strain WP1) TaxID=578459 RepID=A0A0P9IQA7_RHOGW|nr:uncharacterized protein RHOBADRAFT_47573 [Rhodotorula graminis WP1]KPV71619.1 hypothetical protein RHOBADRAFT_47573 [Rhodotorula graminis WP1]
MSAEPAPQPCEVCGVETTRRCSACVKAGISLFFCGKDHQKLIWPAHKTVCGPGKAHPFMVEPLSDEEVAWVRGELGTTSLASGVTLSQELVDLSQSDRSAKSILGELTGNTYLTSKIRKENLIVQWIRAVYVGQKHARLNSPSKMDLQRVFADKPNRLPAFMTTQPSASILRRIYAKLEALYIGVEVDESTWFSLVQHKALIMSYLLQVSVVRGHPDELQSYWELCCSRMYAWIRAGAGSNDPRIERALASFRGAGEEVLDS